MAPDLNFGRYALFVWSAYGATAVAFAGMILASLLRARACERQLTAALARQSDRRREAGETDERGAPCA